MEANLLILLSVLVIGFGIIIFLLNRKIAELKNQSSERALIEWLKTMQTSLEMTNKTINQVLSSNTDRMVQTLQENSKQLNDRLDKAAQVIKTVGIEVGQMSEIGRSMRELQEFLKSPKLRGNIGEEILKDLLSQIFPQNSFYLQYQFKSGEKVDAAIKTDGGILPIDSKFPLESFQRMVKNNEEAQKEVLKKEFIRDVKKHIDNIAKKYIIPDEGTMDFALMYVPSEAVFYEICNLNDILEYARRSRVYLVSPSTLYVHLQTILLSFEGKKIESRSKEVFKIIRSLEIEYSKVQENLTILGRHLNNASTQFTNVSMGISQMGNKLTATKILEEKVIESS